MIVIPDTGTATVAAEARLRNATNNLPSQSSDPGDPETPSPLQTVARVGKAERGDVSKKDIFATAEEPNGESTGADMAVRARKERAKEVVSAVTRAIASHGTARMAGALQILRRELSKCHDVLGPLKSERDFLSMIVLAETELGTKDWKEISRQELTIIKAAADLGRREERITFDDYNHIFRQLAALGGLSGPPIDFGDNEPDQEDE